MQQRIHILPDEVISRIAAGEVIERPASVIKELIENSFDAGANKIYIEIRQSGKTYIKVKDNGCGIEKEDLNFIFLRHATSKINRFEDLSNIYSLGFRGEALYSIASVSEVFLRTKTLSSENGWEIHIKNGKKSQITPVAMQNGTEIEVYNLFFNVPARRKFLKSDTTELRKIIEIIIPYAIFSPEKLFTLIHNKKYILELKSSTSFENRIENIFRFKSESLHQLTHKSLDGSISLHLILGDINIQRTKRDAQFLFINSRPVYCAGIFHAINEVYRSLMPPESHPFFAIFINIPPKDIDVNIHPTKREVKIKNEYAVIELIKQLCIKALNKETGPKQVYLKEEFKKPEQKISEKSENYQINLPQASIFNQHIQPEDRSYQTFHEKFSHARFVGNIMGTYLVFDADDRIYIIDQHAAHERIVFEKLLNQARYGKIKVQQLLVPVTIALTVQEMMVWEQGRNLILEEIGFQTTKWDEKTIAVHTSPDEINNPEIAVRNVLSDTSTKFNIEELLRKACRSSTMANEKLTPDEAESLKKQLFACEHPLTCPHGRPTIIEIERTFIEKQFLR